MTEQPMVYVTLEDVTTAQALAVALIATVNALMQAPENAHAALPALRYTLDVIAARLEGGIRHA